MGEHDFRAFANKPRGSAPPYEASLHELTRDYTRLHELTRDCHLARAGFEYAVEGKASRCKLFKAPILSTLPVGGARCYKKASKTELGPHKKRL